MKQRLIAADFKKTFQHAHIKGLSKAPGTGKQIHLPPVLQQFRYEHGFIYIIEILSKKFLKVFNSNRKFFPFHPPTLLSGISSAENTLPLSRSGQAANAPPGSEKDAPTVMNSLYHEAGRQSNYKRQSSGQFCRISSVSSSVISPCFHIQGYMNISCTSYAKARLQPLPSEIPQLSLCCPGQCFQGPSDNSSGRGS